jgi:hypothetical protein
VIKMNQMDKIITIERALNKNNEFISNMDYSAEAKLKTLNINLGDAKELILYSENDYALMQKWNEWIKLFKKKMAKGNYDSTMAIKGIANNFVPLVIQHYKKEVGYLSPISYETKVAIGWEMEKYFRSENASGNYD